MCVHRLHAARDTRKQPQHILGGLEAPFVDGVLQVALRRVRHQHHGLWRDARAVELDDIWMAHARERSDLASISHVFSSAAARVRRTCADDPPAEEDEEPDCMGVLLWSPLPLRVPFCSHSPPSE